MEPGKQSETVWKIVEDEDAQVHLTKKLGKATTEIDN